ncbi:MAG: DUF983 domain-containing protein [Caulobacteraceae bacterium]
MAVVETHARSLSDGVRRGMMGRCPNCGQGRLFSGYLSVEPTCEACGHDLARYRADDGPAYVTILLVGHLIVAPLLCFRFIWTWNPVLVVALTCSGVLAATLAILPRVKGGFIGALWATNANPLQ